MANVYFKKIGPDTTVDEVNAITQELLDVLVEQEGVVLEENIPLKVHFGEPGNVTFVMPENYDGIIDWLEARNIKTSFIETGVLYGGKRYTKKLHLETAKKHGFTRIPVIIADGNTGEDFHETEINKNHFSKCRLGKEFSNYDQILVLSHFKGHVQAGFGGAMKQISMGFASKGGKLAVHMGNKPQIVSRKCVQCHSCEEKCAEDALTIGDKSKIDQEKCTGCGACIAACPEKAITIFNAKGISNTMKFSGFREKLVEYAYAAQKGKRHIYLNFVMNVTSGCDCHGTKMKILMEDIGIFASIDAVAIDKACYDMVKAKGKKFRGAKMFQYAEEIGLGSTDYSLRES